MSERLTIEITARDGTSQVFRAISSEATRAGTSVANAGKTGAAGLDQLTKKAEDTGQALDTMGTALVGFGAATTAAFAFAANASIGFESAMANVQSIARMTGPQLESTGDSVRALAVELGKSPTELAEGLYDIQSSGFEGAAALDILRASTISAGAGLTTTATSAKAITAVLNAYGLEATEAGNVSDLLFKAVDSGVITFDALAKNLGSVLAPAAALKVPLEEITAAFAELTLQGIGASQAETGIAAFMRSAIAPTDAMKAAIEDYGYASAEALIQTEGLVGFLAFLQEATGGSSTALIELLGSTESATTALALMRNEGSNYNAMIGEMSAATSDGAFAFGVFQIQAETTQGALNRLGASFENAQIAAGNAIAPFVELGANGLAGMLDGFTSLPEPIQATVTSLGALGGASALVVGSLALAVPRVIALRAAMQTLAATAVGAKAFGAAATGIGLAFNPLTLTIGAVVAGGALLAKGWLDQRQAADDYRASVSNLEMTLETLRRQGDTVLADLVEGTSDAVDEIVTMERTVEGLGQMVTPGSERAQAIDEQARAIDQLLASAGLAEQAQNKLNEALSDPSIDANRFAEWADGLVQSALATEDATDDLAALQAIANVTLSDFSRFNDAADSVDTATSAIATLRTELEGGAQAMAELAANDVAAKIAADFKALEEGAASAFSGFISNGDNILDFWLSYQDQVREATIAHLDQAEAMEKGGVALADYVTPAEEAFARIVSLADDLDDAGAALDRVLTVYSQIDALGARSASAGSIADALIGEPGVWATIDDLLASSRINLEQYNEAVGAGTSIQQSNLNVQEDLNAMRAAQLPLLAQEQVAYEAQIDAISQLPALEQRRALALQDSAVQAQLATQYATAYQASVGEIPEEVATQMIVSAAEADPVIADLLLNMGLIEEGADGELRVNFPDGDTVQQSIMMLTDSVDALTLAMGGVPPLRVEADTAAAEAAIGTIEGLTRDIDGRVVRTAVEADTQDAAAGISAVDGLYRELDGRVMRLSAEADTDQAQSAITETINAIGGIDGASATATINAVDNASGVTRNAQGVIRSTDGVVGTGTLRATDLASGVTRAAQSVVSSLAGKSVTLTAIDNASGPANAAQSAINALSSRSVTLTTYYKTVGSPPSGMIGPTRLHGGMAEYALGGNVVPIWAGEAGPEIAHFPAGGNVMLPREGPYNVPQGSFIEPANSARGGGGINITFTGNFYGSNRQELNEWAKNDLLPAIARESERRDVAMGLAS